MVSEKETNQYQCITHTSHQGKLLPPAPIAYQTIDRIGNDEGDRRIEENIDNSSYLVAFSTETTSHLQNKMTCKYKHGKSKEPARHQLNDANDLLFQKGKEPVWFHGKRIDNSNTHGTGCTLSSAIASNLAKGRDLETSVKYAKNYISGALAAMLDLGKGSGPMNHAFAVKGEYEG